MLKEKKTFETVSKIRLRKYTCVIYVYECDECHIIFERKQCSKNSMHFCTRDCYQNSMKFGKAREYVKSKMTDEVIKKQQNTMIKKYGYVSSFHLSGVLEKAQNTCIERYGGISSMCDENVRNKKEQTFIKKYGTHAPLAYNSLVFSKSLDTQFQRYGTMFSKTVEFKERIKKTNFERFGVDHPMKSDEFKQKFDFNAMWKKQHETKKKNGTYAASKIEKQFGNLLNNFFGAENVEYQIQIKNWIIDFYVKPLDLYIQFDGIYWHGLDRPIEKIKEFQTIRDETIFRIWQKDREQEQWFITQGLRLIRITDQEFKQNPELILEMVTNEKNSYTR